eukprot:TRINITY_DN13636_c0_g1_i2.p1 TRINITY_DN13636_c0_g1~~TRINITY_DN13636_c0_g1_i2.p1  ORF type:complete len:113 (-),score=13.67 TRINITY_DN13636_c0_g1_i2:62-400(-)
MTGAAPCRASASSLVSGDAWACQAPLPRAAQSLWQRHAQQRSVLLIAVAPGAASAGPMEPLWPPAAAHDAAVLLRWDVPCTVLCCDVLDSACLLYTSPSPRDRTRSRMPSSA